MSTITQNSRRRRWLLHAYRVGIFVFLLLMIHRQHDWYVAQKRGAMKQLVTAEMVRAFFPGVASLSDWDVAHGGQNVFDAAGDRLGYVIQTSPEADDVVGFSGPTNTLVAFGKNNRIKGAAVLRSDDTREHLEQVVEDEEFFRQWNDLGRNDVGNFPEIDAVSSATLTSMAIADGIALRLGGDASNARFPEEVSVAELQVFLPGAARLSAVEGRPFLRRVEGKEGELLGFASRTSPHADHMIGYQGPTDLLLVLDEEERLGGVAIRKSYDNEEFVNFLVEDEYFFNSFKGFELHEIAQIDLVESGIDVVTGATKSSVTAAEGLIAAALEISRVRQAPTPKRWFERISWRDVGTALVVLSGLAIAFTRLRGKRWLRGVFQVVLVIYLGFINADMVSQALLVGWAQNGVAWRVAPALVFLAAAALAAPIFTGRQVYCTHLCPYGAVQDWLSKASPWRVALRGWLERILAALPVILLLWVVVVALGHLPFSLVGIEPFDAFVFRIAGWLTITVAIVGLVGALFVPRAYCRYGCPTGAMLKFLRIGASSEHFGLRDWLAAGFALIAIGLMLWR